MRRGGLAAGLPVPRLRDAVQRHRLEVHAQLARAGVGEHGVERIGLLRAR